MNEPSLQCGRCKRPIVRLTRCVYCGWSPDAAETTAYEPPKIEEEIFRSGTTLAPFIGLAIITPLSCWFIGWMLWRFSPPRRPAMVYVIMAGAILSGMVPAVVQGIRRSRIWVRLIPERGVEFGRRGIVPWGEIRHIELAQPQASLHASALQDSAAMWGCLLNPTRVFFRTIGELFHFFLQTAAGGGYSSLFTRITVEFRSTERLLIYDLKEAERFVRIVRMKITGS
jgi:hypothetical protein